MTVVHRRGARAPKCRTTAPQAEPRIQVGGREYALETCRAHRTRKGEVSFYLSWIGRKGRQILHGLLGVECIAHEGDVVVIEHPDKGDLTLSGVTLAEAFLDVA